jgi:hypothetical protein
MALAVAPSGAAARATVLAEPPPGSHGSVTTSAPAIAPTPREGGSLLVYESPVDAPPGVIRNEIRARRVDAAGQPAGEPVVIASPPAGTSLAAPRLAVDPAGDASLVVWRELHGTVGYGHTNDGRVRARRVSAGGMPAGPELALGSLTAELTGADVDFDRLGGVWAVAWSSRDGVRARKVGKGGEKVGKPRVLAARTEASEVTVGATRKAFLIAWVQPAGRRASAVYARVLSAESPAAGRRKRIALPRPREATWHVVSDLDLAYDTRRRRLALAYSAWWDTGTSEGDTEVNVQRLTPAGMRIGSPTWLDVELNTENLGRTRIAYNRASDSFRVIWWYEEIPSGPVCRHTKIRTRSVTGAWKARPPQSPISSEGDPAGPAHPNAAGSQCRVPPDMPAIAPAGDGGWLAAWTRHPYVLGLRLGP